MSYEVRYSKKATKQLSKLDRHTASVIIAWMEKNINHSDNPRVHGKGLVENHSGEWRYRVGDYRIICDIKDDELIVLALSVSHRREAY
ncbi:type II toxin-antitoxin system RelE family toxin [Secundilactobacillus kimchicus]|uniref:type II toxin-antitoxin system RelE family toxin n=1 Tax=Secundilactobacillus kimchicus TaxID=528209 RepID=UPI0024A81E9A|nr:type II toxin-antitoxin system RelE/ParE family toxin [Secundilactobacillus kimchicus]